MLDFYFIGLFPSTSERMISICKLKVRIDITLCHIIGTKKNLVTPRTCSSPFGPLSPTPHCMAPILPQLYYPPWCLPLNRTLLPSNHPKKLTSSPNPSLKMSVRDTTPFLKLCPCTEMPCLCYVTYFLLSFVFFAYPFLHTLQMFFIQHLFDDISHWGDMSEIL